MFEKYLGPIDSQFVPCTNKHPWSKRLNPLWWLVGDNGWDVPDINNGAPYMPGKPQWLRFCVWFFVRNPLMNFVGSVIGVGEFDFWQYGPAPVAMTTWADANPPRRGWKWAMLRTMQPNWLWIFSYVLYGFLTFRVSSWFALPWVFSWFLAFGHLPFVSYSGRVVFYIGWRTNSGGFGIKLVNGKFK
jgi:hypothetical protein